MIVEPSASPKLATRRKGAFLRSAGRGVKVASRILGAGWCILNLARWSGIAR
jgi:hypothetical protein